MGGSPYHQKWSAYTIRMKRSRLLALVIVVALPAIAQNLPGEKSPISHSLNRWITMSSREPYDLVFLYFDEEAEAGTLLPGGSFRVGGDGRCVKIAGDPPAKEKPPALRVMQNMPVVLLSEKCRGELGLPDRPALLKSRDTSSVAYRVKLGSWLNYLEDHEAALVPLESAWKENPAAEGLAKELAFTCNMLKRFDRAVAVASDGVKRDAKDYRLANELAYALLGAGRIDEAIARYLATIDICPDNELKIDMASNLAVAYRQRGDDENAEKWLDNAIAWTPADRRK